MQKFTKLGDTVSNSNTSSHYDPDSGYTGYHTLKVEATLNSIDVINLNANITLKCILISEGAA